MKIVFLLLFIALSGRVIAQQKFIEVRVSDTVLGKAEIFVYRIMMNPSDWVTEIAARQDTDYSDYGKRLDHFRRLEKQTFDSVVVSLRTQFALLSPNLADTFRIASGVTEIYIARFLFHSVDSLSRFYNRLKTVKYIFGTVEMARAKDEKALRDALFRKLLGEATDEAGKIAALNHQRLGGVISVTEEKLPETSGGWTSYAPLSSLGDAAEISGWHTIIRPDYHSLSQSGPIDDSYAINGALTVRFSIE